MNPNGTIGGFPDNPGYCHPKCHCAFHSAPAPTCTCKPILNECCAKCDYHCSCEGKARDVWEYPRSPELPPIIITCPSCLQDVNGRHFRSIVCPPCEAEAKAEYSDLRGYLEQRQFATPKGTDLKAIAAIYAAARNISRESGVLHHVDHIIPIRGIGVAGLHVAWNLRIIPAIENQKKGNRVDPKLLHHKPDLASVPQHHTEPAPGYDARASQRHPTHKVQRPVAQPPQTAKPRLVKAKHSAT